MTISQQLLLLAAIAYIVGSIPFGLLIGFARGVDVRAAGSGNIGATNVGRLLGKRFFALVFGLDLLKGLIPVLIGAAMIHGRAPSRAMFTSWLLVGLAAILGHLFSIFLKFKGGKGVATSTGAMLGFFPYFTLPGLMATGVFLAVLKGSRFVSLASICAAAALPILYVGMGFIFRWDLFGTQLPLLIFAVVIAGLIVFKHRANIARLRAGTEHRAGVKRAVEA